MPTTKKSAKRSKPQRRTVRVSLDEEDFKLLDEVARRSLRGRAWHAEILLRNAVRASWAYEFTRQGDIPAVTSARDFFSELYHLQAKALEEIERAGNAAKNAAGEAAKRCQQWLDAEKARRADSTAEPKVLKGKFHASSTGGVS